MKMVYNMRVKTPSMPICCLFTVLLISNVHFMWTTKCRSISARTNEWAHNARSSARPHTHSEFHFRYGKTTKSSGKKAYFPFSKHQQIQNAFTIRFEKPVKSREIPSLSLPLALSPEHTYHFEMNEREKFVCEMWTDCLFDKIWIIFAKVIFSKCTPKCIYLFAQNNFRSIRRNMNSLDVPHASPLLDRKSKGISFFFSLVFRMGRKSEKSALPLLVDDRQRESEREHVWENALSVLPFSLLERYTQFRNQELFIIHFTVFERTIWMTSLLQAQSILCWISKNKMLVNDGDVQL